MDEADDGERRVCRWDGPGVRLPDTKDAKPGKPETDIKVRSKPKAVFDADFGTVYWEAKSDSSYESD